MSYIFFNDPHKDKLSVDQINNFTKRNILKQNIISDITNAKEKFEKSYKNYILNKNQKTEIHKNASKIYYQDIVNFYKKYGSLKPCRVKNKSNAEIKNCEGHKRILHNVI